MKQINISLSIQDVFDLVRLEGVISSNTKGLSVNEDELETFKLFVEKVCDIARDAFDEIEDDAPFFLPEDGSEEPGELKNFYCSCGSCQDDTTELFDDQTMISSLSLSELTPVTATFLGKTVKLTFDGDLFVDDQTMISCITPSTLTRKSKELIIVNDEHPREINRFFVNKWPKDWTAMIPCNKEIRILHEQ
jgi:hypothetical protein